jgi:uncharacterized protein
MDVTTPIRQVATLRERAHRPWPLPRRPFLMAQTWESLLFAHWPLAPERLRTHVPSALPLDTFDGRAWLGITPFRLSGLRLAATPPLPRLSTFPELNVRTYVTVGGKPGIYFFSLDAGSSLAVAGARRFYRLPYFRAEMSIDRDGGETHFASRRIDARGHPATFRAGYGPDGDEARAAPGTLEHFLTERYCLYTLTPDGRVARGEIHHPPWPLRRADADIALNTMPPPGLEVPAEAPLCHFSARQDVLVWALDLVR